MKKIALFITLAAATLSLLAGAPAAYGQTSDSVPTNETNKDLLDNIDTVQEKSTDILQQDYREWNQTFVLTRIKRQLLDRLTGQIVRYIQGGGTPRFITNWEDFLRNSADAAAGEFLNELAGTNLCAPFANKLGVFFARGGGMFNTGFFRNRAQCTLSDIVGNIEDFYQDFSRGGWAGYAAAWEPQNNIYGSYLLGLTELTNRVTSAQQAALSEATAGQGFLGSRDDQGNIQTPGAVIAHLAEKTIDADFDFINDADQLRNFAGVIGDALVNRLLTEAGGFLNEDLDQHSNEYNRFVGGRDVARGQTEQAVFRNQERKLVRDIDQAIVLRRSVQSSLDALLETAKKTDPSVTITTVLAQIRQSLEGNRDYLVDIQNKFLALTESDIIQRVGGGCPAKLRTPVKISKNIVPDLQNDIDSIINGIDAIGLVEAESIAILEAYASDIATLTACGGEISGAGTTDVSNTCMLDILSYYRGVITGLENNEAGRGTLDELQTTLGGNIVQTARAMKQGIQQLHAVRQKTTKTLCEGKGFDFLSDETNTTATYQSLYNRCTKDPIPGDVSNPAFCATE